MSGGARAQLASPPATNPLCNCNSPFPLSQARASRQSAPPGCQGPAPAANTDSPLPFPRPKTKPLPGASVASTCNPQDANYATFYAQLGAGSWLEVQDGATHMDYVSPLKNLVEMPPVCGKGGMSPQVAGFGVKGCAHLRARGRVGSASCAARM